MMKKRGIHKQFTLKRDLGLISTTACGVGMIVGAGIYVLIGAAAGLGGNAVWISFLIAAIVAAFTGLSYAELSSIFPKDSGEYIYAEHAVGKRLAFVSGYAMILVGVVSIAAVAIGLGGYFTSLFGMSSTSMILIIGAIAIILFSLINLKGIKTSAGLNIIFTLIEVGGLILIIFLALKFIGKVNYFETSGLGVPGILSAAALIFFAFLGFESIVKLSEETKNARKIIPKALLLSIVITSILYVLVGIAAVSVLGWQKLAQSSAPLADVANIVLGNNAFLLLAIIALFATGNTILIILVTTSRMIYGMGKDIKPLKFLSAIYKRTRTPWLAVVITGVLAIMFLFFKDIATVANITNFLMFFIFIMVNLSLIILRYKMPDIKRGFKVPLNIGKFPILATLGVITCIFMIFNIELDIILYGLIILMVGLGTEFLVEIAEKKSKKTG